jgi:hypothetical protein
MKELDQWLVALAAVTALGLAIVLTVIEGSKIKKADEFRQGMIACLNNDAYVGLNVEDTRALFLQCLDDYKHNNLRSMNESDNR